MDAIKWNHSNGFDYIITNPEGNTVCGPVAHEFYFGVQKRMRMGEFSGMELENYLIDSLYKSSDFKKENNQC